ncbi:MAG: MbcA/ParS/Xre antitoxin family protein [Acidobacteriota bacterium]|nr:MbcA/ParS/Xre antitoxin family protein [Acidobacteriota bacterium]
MGALLVTPIESTIVERRHDPEVRRQMSAPALRTFFRIGAAWGLNVTEQRALLGWPAASTFHKYKSGDVGAVSYDCLTRLSLVVGIYTALHMLYAEDGLADRWIKLPNSNALFGGQPALTLMKDGGIDGLYKVRRLLDGRRG